MTSEPLHHTITTEITTKAPEPMPADRLRLSAGWRVEIPRLTPDYTDPTIRSLIAYEAQSERHKQLAKKRVAEALTERWKECWISGLKEVLRYYMRAYAKRHPKQVTEEGELVGFDPEIAARWYAPMDNVGRAGKSFILQGMASMANGGTSEKD